MKKIMITALALFFVLASIGICGAQTQTPSSDKSTGQTAQKQCPMMMQQKGAPGAQMNCKGYSMGGHGRMEKEVVATQDGGVVVLMGGRLLKYDKDLNLVKQVDVPIDEYMKKMMEAHHPDMMDQQTQTGTPAQ